MHCLKAHLTIAGKDQQHACVTGLWSRLVVVYNHVSFQHAAILDFTCSFQEAF